MAGPVFRKVDCIRIPVPDIEAGLSFYRDRLGHALLWRTESAAGLAMPDSDAEIVVHAEGLEPEANLLVESVEAAAGRIVEAGGGIIEAPFDIRIGRCAVVRDPWGNRLVVLDMSKGRLATDEDGKVVGTEPL